MIEQSMKITLCGTGNQWRSSQSVGVMLLTFRFRNMSRAADSKTDRTVFVAVMFIWYNYVSEDWPK